MTPNTPAGRAVKYAGPHCQACGRAFLYPKGCGCPAPTLIQSSLAHHPPRPSTVSADAVRVAFEHAKYARDCVRGGQTTTIATLARLNNLVDELESLTREVRK